MVLIVYHARLDEGIHVAAGTDRAIAQSIEEGLSRTLTQDDQALPLIQHGVWRMVLGVTGGYQAGQAPYRVTGIAGGLVLLIMVVPWAARWRPGDRWYLVFVGLYVILAPPLMLLARQGGAVMISAVFAVAATLLHLRRLHDQRLPLSMGAAFLIGWLASLRMEWVALWILMLVHALVWRYPSTSTLVASRGLILVRGTAGFLWILIGLAPFVGWNMYALGMATPWPEFPNAPMTLNAFAAAGPLTTLSEIARQVVLALPGVYARFLTVPLLEGSLSFFVFAVGMVYFLLQMARRALPAELLFIPLTLLVLPLLVSLFIPFTGWDGLGMVVDSISLLWIPAMAWTAWDITLNVLRAMASRCPPHALAPLRTLALLVVAVVLLLHGLAQSTGTLQRNFREVKRDADDVNRFAGILTHDEVRGVATDRPDLLDGRVSWRVIDLTRERSPQLYAYPAFGLMNHETWARACADHDIGWLLIWGAGYQLHAEDLGLLTRGRDGDAEVSGPILVQVGVWD